MTQPETDFSAVCPYLGLADDADSHATYATEAHRCYRLPNPTRIASGHQEAYCLGASHVTCPVYQGEGTGTAPQPGAALPPAAAPGRSGAGQGAAGRLPGATPAKRPRPAGEARPRRQPREGAPAGPRPRSGGISMPAATIGLFALAVVVLVIAVFIQQNVGGDGNNGKISPADQVATNAALKTRQAAQILASLGLSGHKTLIVVDKADTSTSLSFRNIPRVKVISVEGVNVYDVVDAESLIITSGALGKIQERLAAK